MKRLTNQPKKMSRPYWRKHATPITDHSIPMKNRFRATSSPKYSKRLAPQCQICGGPSKIFKLMGIKSWCVARPRAYRRANFGARNRQARALTQWRLIFLLSRKANFLRVTTWKTGWELCSRLASKGSEMKSAIDAESPNETRKYGRNSAN